MSWDPNTAVVLYQPIDFYAIGAKEVSKSIGNTKVALEKMEKELSLYEPKSQEFWLGRKITVVSAGLPGHANTMNKSVTATKIQKLEEIQSFIEMLAKDLSVATKGFERILALEIAPVNNTIVKLNMICESYLVRHQETLSSQQRFS